jgi:medium-chain acyl-[acyl-carrier-protein] hydrolase
MGPVNWEPASPKLAGSWFVCSKGSMSTNTGREADALRLFCFPYAGGSASIFRTWHSSLPNWVDIHSVQPPGRANRIAEPPFTRIAELTAMLGASLLPLLDRPFAFFGHSLGALVSFEVARWLRRGHDLSPAHLFVAARRAPQLQDADLPSHPRSDESLLKELAVLNGTHKELLANRDLLRLVLPAVRADFEVAETYVYTEDAPLQCPITVFGARDDEECLDERMEAWRLQTTNVFTRYTLDGNHFFIHSNEHELLKHMRKELCSMLASQSKTAKDNR